MLIVYNGNKYLAENLYGGSMIYKREERVVFSRMVWVDKHLFERANCTNHILQVDEGMHLYMVKVAKLIVDVTLKGEAPSLECLYLTLPRRKVDIHILVLRKQMSVYYCLVYVWLQNLSFIGGPTFDTTDTSFQCFRHHPFLISSRFDKWCLSHANLADFEPLHPVEAQILLYILASLQRTSQL